MQFAQKVVIAVSEISPFPISLSNEKGIIIGANDPARIGTYHKPSIEVLAQNDMVLFTEEKIKSMENVLPGVAVPLTLRINRDIKTIGVLGIIGKPEKVKPYAKLIKKYVEMMWQDILLNDIITIEEKMLDSFLHNLLLSDPLQPEKLIQYSEILHIPRNQNRFCIIVDIGDSILNNIAAASPISITHMKEMLLKEVKSAYKSRHKKNLICSFLNTEKIICVKDIPSEYEYNNVMETFSKESNHLLTILKRYNLSNVQVAAGNIQPSLDLIHKSYFEAEQLLEFANKNKLKMKIFNYYEWNVLLALMPLQMDGAFRNKIMNRISPLLDDESSKELVYSFIVYCQCNFNISKAANKLFIHRNTLIYRLMKIEKHLNLDLKSFENCMLLYMTLKNKKIS